jgi:hypothetical protein
LFPWKEEEGGIWGLLINQCTTISFNSRDITKNFVGTKKYDLILQGLKTKLQIFIGIKNLINAISYNFSPIYH